MWGNALEVTPDHRASGQSVPPGTGKLAFIYWFGIPRVHGDCSQSLAKVLFSLLES